MYVHFVHINEKRAAEVLFEWDESKRQSNLAKHLVDFQDATQIFDGPVFEKARQRHGEDRVLAIGLMEDVEIVVVYVMRGKRRYVMRGKRRRIIAARRAHRDERKDY